jgi:fatty acid desaturase
MRAARAIGALSASAAALLVCAPAALAAAGQGWYGETDDKVVTNVMFLTIAFFAVVVTAFTLIQMRLDKRKHARLEAQKRRAAGADWRGGW